MTPSLAESLRTSGTDDPLLQTALSQLGTYRDLYLHSLDGEADGSEKKLHGEQKEAIRKAAVVHALNHVLKWVNMRAELTAEPGAKSYGTTKS